MANSPQKKPRRFGRQDYGLFFIVVLIIIGLVMLLTRDTNPPVELDLGDFWTYVDNGQIKELKASPAGSGANANI